MITVIIPYVREKGAERCADAAHMNAGIDDGLFDVFPAYDVERIGAPKMVKAMVEVCDSDMICFLGDDTVPQPDYLKHALDRMLRFPDGWGLVGLNDGIIHGGDKPAAHWLGHKRLLNHIGGEFFHTGYYHLFCDNELTARARAIDRYAWAEDARVEHLHPLFEKGAWDEDYRRVYSSRYRVHDRSLFTKRMTEGFHEVCDRISDH